LRLRSVKLLQTKRRKTIRWYLVEGGGIQHFQIKFKFWHYTTNKFELQAHKHKHMKLFIDIVIKQIYLFNTVAWNYRKKIGFPVCKKENFAGLQALRKRGKSARASPTPHHTLNEERSARFTAQPLSALVGWLPKLLGWIGKKNFSAIGLGARPSVELRCKSPIFFTKLHYICRQLITCKTYPRFFIMSLGT